MQFSIWFTGYLKPESDIQWEFGQMSQIFIWKNNCIASTFLKIIINGFSRKNALLRLYFWENYWGRSMVLLLGGWQEYEAHVWNETGNLICFRHLFTTVVTQLDFSIVPYGSFSINDVFIHMYAVYSGWRSTERTIGRRLRIPLK